MEFSSYVCQRIKGKKVKWKCFRQFSRCHSKLSQRKQLLTTSLPLKVLHKRIFSFLLYLQTLMMVHLESRFPLLVCHNIIDTFLQRSNRSYGIRLLGTWACHVHAPSVCLIAPEFVSVRIISRNVSLNKTCCYPGLYWYRHDTVSFEFGVLETCSKFVTIRLLEYSLTGIQSYWNTVLLEYSLTGIQSSSAIILSFLQRFHIKGPCM